MVSAKPFRASDVPQGALGELYELFAEHIDRLIADVPKLAKKTHVFLSALYGMKEPEIIIITNEEDFRKHCKNTRRTYLLKYKAWYDNGRIILNMKLTSKEHRTIQNPNLYTILHEFRHHMQREFVEIGRGKILVKVNTSTGEKIFTNERQFIESDAYIWARNLLKRINRVPRLRKQKLEADRRCRERYPERYGKKGSRNTGGKSRDF